MTNNPQWVISKYAPETGEKWEVDETHAHYRSDICWQVPCKDARGAFMYLPKSEYIPTTPPERWENIPFIFSPALAGLLEGLCEKGQRVIEEDGKLVLQRRVSS